VKKREFAMKFGGRKWREVVVKLQVCSERDGNSRHFVWTAMDWFDVHTVHIDWLINVFIIIIIIIIIIIPTYALISSVN
jgi:hypothetical protein